MLRLLESERDRADWDELAQSLEGRQEGMATLLVVEEGFPEAWLEALRKHLPPSLPRGEVLCSLRGGRRRT
ncbi:MULTISPECIES: hypothetical protein [Thermus]|uniref:Uncharacterized protein n=1 Tax=Thermus scotoductus TaxID=37636 RepID=A0A430UM78_THESC|nr:MULTISPECIES: hypothetical protein [Thermus]ETN87655.1 hypothetical protein TNMX_11040 [Thermus sp. NMX2.A1]RTI05577.1 hypothetical protein CSW30_11255 [Thermus scotoductus]